MDSLCLTSRCADANGPGVFSGYLTAPVSRAPRLSRPVWAVVFGVKGLVVFEVNLGSCHAQLRYP